MAGTRSSAKPIATTVADASVIVKWFVKERYSEDAERLKNDHVDLDARIVVPSVASYEILNALKYSNAFGVQELIRISKDLCGFQFIEIPLDEGYGEVAVRIASEYGLTLYDSSYLAIGQIRSIPVFTADEKVLERVGALRFVHHIRDYSRDKLEIEEEKKRNK